ncbi:hypothetical protein ACFL6U_07840 [Planctomycetota bacterium]
MELTDNVNIKRFRPLLSPSVLRVALPATERGAQLVASSRYAIQKILVGESQRLMVIVGPCSLHDPQATLAYAEKLKTLQENLGGRLLIVMRAYVEKPRTSLGWKGMIYDP